MSDPHHSGDPPLPSTVRFVSFLGAFLVIAWFAMFFLLRSRW
jgi:hypothetical protein